MAHRNLEEVEIVGNDNELDLLEAARRGRFQLDPRDRNLLINENDLGIEREIPQVDPRERPPVDPRNDLSDSEDDEIEVNMPPTKGELQMLLSAIPEFTTGQNLSIFIKETDNLIHYLRNRLTPDLKYLVEVTIRSKIKGEPRDYISNQGAKTWRKIRRALLTKYGEQRSEEILVSVFSHLVQKKGEPYMEFYSRLLKSFNDVMETIILNVDDQGLLNYKKAAYEKLFLDTFLRGILEPHRSYLGNFELGNIDQALKKCKTFDNRAQEWEYGEFIRKTQDMQVSNAKPNPKPQYSGNPFRSYPKANQQPFNRQQQGYNQNPQNYQNRNPYFQNSRNPNFPPGRNFQNNPRPFNPQQYQGYPAARNEGEGARAFPKQEPASAQSRTRPQQERRPPNFREMFNLQTEVQQEENFTPEYEDPYYEEPQIPEEDFCDNMYEGENFQVPASEEPPT